jgi:NADPH-dependent 2,4-dienoyl-CoA reductase/sulfur reductase-like enzyme
MRRIVIVASVLQVILLAAAVGTVLALDCHGRLVVIGASPWEVKERCGEPSAIEDGVKHLPQRAYDPVSQATVYILVPVQQSIWTYNFGSTRFLYYLTFQEGKLIDITTGDYGH